MKKVGGTKTHAGQTKQATLLKTDPSFASTEAAAPYLRTTPVAFLRIYADWTRTLVDTLHMPCCCGALSFHAGLQRVVSGRKGFATTRDDGADGIGDGFGTEAEATEAAAENQINSFLDADAEQDAEQDAGLVDWSPPPVTDGALSTAGVYLVKRKGGAFGRSRRRWFAIDEANRRIVYHVDKQAGDAAQEPRGFIPLDRSVKVSVLGKQLIVATPSRTFSLAASTTIVPQEWHHTLSKIIEAPGSSLSPSGSSSSSLTKMNVDGSSEPWDVGAMKKAAAEEAVLAPGSNHGDFLVRRIKTGGKVVVCINDDGEVFNITVSCNAGGVLEYGGKEHGSLDSLIDQMRAEPPTNSDGDKLWLKAAASVAAAAGGGGTKASKGASGNMTSSEQEYGFKVDTDAETLEI